MAEPDPSAFGTLSSLASGASVNSADSDRLFWLLTGVCGVAGLAILGVLVVFAIRYRQGSSADRSNPRSNAPRLEAAWTITPIVLFLAMFAMAAYAYVQATQIPRDATTVYVVAKQWMWKIEHDNGHQEVNELHVPLGRPVVLLMASQDAIHDFFVPAFRIKQDVLPGRYTRMTFTASRAGEYRLLCAEYCGSEHSGMIGKVVVMPGNDYDAWLASATSSAAPSLRTQGAQLYQRAGCASCHDAARGWAPPLAGVFGSRVALQGGASAIADEDYLRRSIVDPGTDIVAGFGTTMPSYAGRFDEDELRTLIAYLRGLQ